MDDRLRIIQYLYDEEVDDPTFARRLTEDEALYREYEQLRQAKENADRRPSRRPDPAIVDDVVETARRAAQESPTPSHSTEDRRAHPPSRTWNRRLQTAGVALTLVLLIGLGWWRAPEVFEDPAAVSSAEGAQQASPSAAERRTREADGVPDWDDSDELVRIHRRLEQLQANSGPDSWGTLQTVSQNRP
jgi:hypothetical protein